MPADGTPAVNIKDRIAALRAEADAAEMEAASVLSEDEQEEIAQIERREVARAKKREALAGKRAAYLAEKLAEAKKAAGGAYVVDSLDLEETAEGMGCYVARSPLREVWKKFRDAIAAANGNPDKADVAYRNLALPGARVDDRRSRWAARGCRHGAAEKMR
jgi:phage-related minor tail protein